jgi:heptosyltransferase-1
VLLKVLLVKTSSLGDLIHTFPAITDAAGALPDLHLDWVVEEAFADVCRWHPAVGVVITAAFRRWRRRPLEGLFGGPLGEFRRAVHAERYDAVIDGQGLFKSAVMARMADGPCHGFGLRSVRESLAALAYRHRVHAPQDLHAIERLRRLFAAALGYPLPAGAPDYGLDPGIFPAPEVSGAYLLLLHGAGWHNKQWPLERWRAVAGLAGEAGYTVCAPWLDETDGRRAHLLAEGQSHVLTIKAGLNEMAALAAGAAGVVALETGFGHLAAALGRPTVTLYGPTGAVRHGTCGAAQAHLSADLACSPCYKKACRYTSNAQMPVPCMSEITEKQVWAMLTAAMAEAGPRARART